MAQTAGNPRFLLKKSDERLVVGELRYQDLQSTQFLKDQVLGLVDGPHAPLTDFVDDPILLANHIPRLPFLEVLQNAAVFWTN
jgi:hypothetical protein